jgi:hypothetical protein
MSDSVVKDNVVEGKMVIVPIFDKDDIKKEISLELSDTYRHKYNKEDLARAIETVAEQLSYNPEYQGMSPAKILTKLEEHLPEDNTSNLTLRQKLAEKASSVVSGVKDYASSAASTAANAARYLGKVGRYASTTGYVAGGKSRRRAKKSSRAKKANRRTRHK